ncbi:MAG: F0F1 ATP synthase subunit epsilon [Candidatus Bipolaricaulota bacterium]|nr:F0F1 ATP synthase subunit epsilon [Candidatus Bipolaricaulota bacterium]
MDCQIIACNRIVFAGKATLVAARSEEGWFGVLPGHAPAVFALADHELRVTTEEGTRSFRVRGGVLSVTPGKVTVLTGEAAPIP